MLPSVFFEKSIQIVVSCIIAYLIGSVSTGLLVSRFFHGPDLHQVGSKSTGASNVQRTMGWKYGLITFWGDALKGLLSCFLAFFLTGNWPLACLPAGLCAVIGHNWPCFFKFKGGKGVATSCGVLLFCFPYQALICFALTIGLIAWKRYISLGSMFLLVSYALFVSFTYQGESRLFVILWTVIMAVICILRHHANIGRLIRGEENKLGKKISKPEA